MPFSIAIIYDPLFIQCLGLVAMVLCVIRLQFNNMNFMLSLSTTSNLMFALQMMLMGNLYAALTCFVSGIRSSVMLSALGRKYRLYVVPSLILAGAVLGLVISPTISWESSILLFPLITGYAEIKYEPSLFRKLTFLSGFLWLSYSLMTGSYGLIIACALSMMSGCIAMLRYDYPHLCQYVPVLKRYSTPCIKAV